MLIGLTIAFAAGVPALVRQMQTIEGLQDEGVENGFLHAIYSALDGW